MASGDFAAEGNDCAEAEEFCGEAAFPGNCAGLGAAVAQVEGVGGSPKVIKEIAMWLRV